MKIVSGNSNRIMSEAVASYLETKLVRTTIRRFADSEVSVEIHENIRGEDVFVIQSTNSPANDNLMDHGYDTEVNLEVCIFQPSPGQVIDFFLNPS